MFSSFEYFQKKLNNIFKEINEKRKAQIDLKSVKQKGSAAAYAADFQQIAFLMSYDDEALKRSYYRGLKEEVKDEIARSNEPGTLELLIRSASRIDEQLYQRHMKKAGKVPSIIRPEMKKDGKTFCKKLYYGPMPIEIDAMQQKNGDRSKKSLIKGSYYNCGKPDHYSKQCQQSRKPQSPTNKRTGHSAQIIAAISQEQKERKLVQHNNLSASCC